MENPCRSTHSSAATDRAAPNFAVFEASDLAAARAQAAADPYVVEGVFESHEVFETVVVFPKEA
ncbi:MAG: hypothetical protein JRG83_05035 [Deltaproteobacteria bacterium]|nr:hypothetical protein [Deltaproteobacteria bacterium]